MWPTLGTYLNTEVSLMIPPPQGASHCVSGREAHYRLVFTYRVKSWRTHSVWQWCWPLSSQVWPQLVSALVVVSRLAGKPLGFQFTLLIHSNDINLFMLIIIGNSSYIFIKEQPEGKQSNLSCVSMGGIRQVAFIYYRNSKGLCGDRVGAEGTGVPKCKKGPPLQSVVFKYFYLNPINLNELCK